jgi:hypothetical protein
MCSTTCFNACFCLPVDRDGKGSFGALKDRSFRDCDEVQRVPLDMRGVRGKKYVCKTFNFAACYLRATGRRIAPGQ